MPGHTDKKKRDDAGMTRKEFNKARKAANKKAKEILGRGKAYRQNKVRRSDFGNITIAKDEVSPRTGVYYDEFGHGGVLRQHD
tara:strand:+ start:5072 stop:5320 length:249 start_codon:yes stop_codon:yes gene_type:complete